MLLRVSRIVWRWKASLRLLQVWRSLEGELWLCGLTVGSRAGPLPFVPATPDHPPHLPCCGPLGQLIALGFGLSFSSCISWLFSFLDPCIGLVSLVFHMVVYLIHVPLSDWSLALQTARVASDSLGCLGYPSKMWIFSWMLPHFW